MKSMKWSIIVCLLSVVFGCVSTKPRTGGFNAVDSTVPVYSHQPSGFLFPQAVARFMRDKEIKFYDKDGKDISVPYNLVTPEEKVAGTIYIFPSLKDFSVFPVPQLGKTPDWFLQRHYDGAKAVIIQKYGARTLSDSEYRINRSILNPTGRKGVFEWDTIGGEILRSQLYVFSHHGWFVKYRFTYPSRHSSKAELEIDRFIGAFQWP
ncbi:MAG: hypothetical protein AAGU11_06995 [Syntrophobacteraceae bacterium]